MKRSNVLGPALVLALLAVLIAAQLCVAASFGMRKDGFDIDELFTYGLANSLGEPFVAEREGEWTSGQRFMDYLTVGDHAHEYLNVYENQIADVHPPLYYLFIHAFCSVFRTARVSKWPGIGVNMLCFLLTQVALFFLSCRLTTGRLKIDWAALLPVAAYGFGAGAITGVVFIRMYAMMTLWAVLLALALVTLWQEGQTNANLFALKAALIGGFLTQYYFVMLACMLCGVYFFAKLLTRRALEAGRFAAHCFLALALAVAMFPWCLAHIFSGYRGRGAMEQVSSLRLADLRRWCSILFDTMNAQQFGALLVPLLALAAVLLAACVLLRRALPFAKGGAAMALAGLAAGMLYLTLVAAISPYKVDRYILCVYPLIATGSLLLLGGALGALGLRRGGAVLAAALLLALDARSIGAGQVNYLFEGRGEVLRVCEAYADVPCVLLGSNDITGRLMELADFDEICVLDKDAWEQVVPKLCELESYDPARGFVLLQRYGDEEVLARIVDAAGASQARLLFADRLTAYFIQ